MARYVARIRTPRPPAEVFDYMADVRNFAEWDPGVRRVVQVVGEGAAPDAVFDVTVANPGRDLTFRYRTVVFDAPNTVHLLATTRLFTSDDRVSVTPDGDGSILVYDARLRLNGPFGLGDPLLGVAFSRVADRAAAGLRRALDGTPVA